MTIASLIIDVAANTAKLQTDVQKIHGTLDGVASTASRLGTVLAGAFTVTAITGLASRLVDYAGKITDLADQTGFSTRAIQQMDFVAKQTGATLEQFTNAAFRLGVNLAGGSNSVQSAVDKLGLSYAQLRAQSPEQQFSTIASALSQVQSAQERNKLAVELFGKSAKDILPAVAQGYDGIAKSAIVAGDQQLRALDMAGDALDAFLSTLKILTIELTGGFIIAAREGLLAMADGFEKLSRPLQAIYNWNLRIAQTMGWASVEMPAAFKASALAASNLPKPLQAVSLSVEEQEQRMKALELQHTKTAASTRTLSVAQAEVDVNIQRLTESFERQIDAFRRQNTLATSVYESFRLMRAEFETTIPVLRNLTTNGFEPFKAAIQDTRDNVLPSFRQVFSDTFTQLPTVILRSIQGGGSVIGAAGSFIGTSLMSKFQEKFGPAIEAALPFGIGNAINALLPTLGALFGPVAEKIAGFFRSIFGGPSADEIRGREAVAAFEAELQKTLNTTQKLEAGNVSWKMTVIAIRDAYMAAGLTEADALLAAEKLWASSKNGASASQLVIDEIRRLMEGGAAAAGSFAANLDYATRPRVIHIGYDVEERPEESYGMGFATGSGGIRNFGSGTPVMLHGRERVQTEAQMKAEQSGGAGAALITEIRALRRELPAALLQAVKTGAALA